MKRTYLYLLPYLLTGLFIFGYVFIRVFTIPITVDECWTLYSFVRTSVWDIVTIKDPSTNNHIFNTLLTKITSIFSEKEFFLRLPNLLALLLYLSGSYKICRRLFTNRVLGVLCFIALMGNFTMIHFFGLCRGYGLSIGLMMFSVAHLTETAKSDSYPLAKQQHIILFCATMAFYANIALLHVMTVILLIFSWLLIKKREQRTIVNSITLPIVYGSIIALLGGLKLYKQYKLGEIFYGGKANFIDDSMASMMKGLAGYEYLSTNTTWTMNISVVLVALSVVVPTFFLKRLKKEPWLAVPWTVLVFNLAMINFQFYVLDVLLPIERVTLFFYPLMILAVFGMLELLYPYIKYAAVIPGAVVSGFCILWFTSNMSLDYMGIWWFDMYSKQIVNDISADSKGTKRKPKLFAIWPMDNGFNYYVNIYHTGKFIETPCCTRFEHLEHPERYDYLYLESENDVSDYPQLKPIKRYHYGSFILYKNTSAN